MSVWRTCNYGTRKQNMLVHTCACITGRGLWGNHEGVRGGGGGGGGYNYLGGVDYPLPPPTHFTPYLLATQIIIHVHGPTCT